MTTITEADVEKAALAWLADLGFRSCEACQLGCLHARPLSRSRCGRCTDPYTDTTVSVSPASRAFMYASTRSRVR